MLFLKLLRFFKGYAQVKVSSGFGERLLNLAMQKNIKVWKVRKDKDGAMLLRVERSQLKQLAACANSSYTTIELQYKVGLPFIFMRYKKRYALLYGGILSLALMIFMSCFIWSYEITGNVKLSEQQIMDTLKKHGFYIGAYKGNIDYYSLYQKVLLDLDELSWITLNVKGTKAQIEIHEREPQPEILDMKTPSNIFATKSGVVRYIAAYSGTAQVAVGQTIEEGQLLISGETIYKDGTVEQTAAVGKVLASTWYTYTYECPATVTIDEPTGEVKNKYSIKFFNSVLKLYFNSGISMKKYDKINIEKQLHIGDNFYLPIYFLCERYEAKKPVDINLTYEQQVTISRKVMEDTLTKRFKEGEIVSRDYSESFKGNTLVTTLKIECLENVANRIPLKEEINVGQNN